MAAPSSLLSSLKQNADPDHSRGQMLKDIFDLDSDQPLLITPPSTLNDGKESSQSSKVEVLFKIPQEQIENISLKLDLEATIEQIKKEIERSHSLKPAPHK